MAKDNVQLTADLFIKHDPDNRNKPYLEIKVPAGGNNQVVVYFSANIAEMIGGAAKGARLRWEDQHPGEKW